MLDLNSLNSQQLEAVTSFEDPTLILAGAGTGKTRVITYRIAYMIENGIPPENIAAMTFTNKAAREMRERLFEMVPKTKAKKVSIGTFHRFCINILRKAPKESNIPSKFTLVGTSDQLDLIRRVLVEKNWDGLYKAENLQFDISTCKNWMISPKDLREGRLPNQPVKDPAVLADVYEFYERQLNLNKAIDFDDCIYKVVSLLRNFPDLKAELQNQYKYILVDEFQDTNSSQFAVVEELAQKTKKICVVGDDDQSIYSWRGAMYETMDKFIKTFEGTNIIKLEQNYRCTNVILGAANGVIKNNLKRMDKTLWSAATDETPIKMAALEDALLEARWVGEQCISLVGAGHKLSDIAILYRANSQAKMMEMSLRECSLSYKTFGGQSFFERKEVKDFLGYLRLIANPADHLALWRVINTPHRGIGLKTQEHIDEKAHEHNMEPFQFMKSEYLADLGSRSTHAVQDFVKLVEEVAAIRLETPDDMESLGEAIISTFKLVDEIKKEAKNPQSRSYKIENLRSLPRWLKKSAEEMVDETGNLSAYQLLDKLTMSETPAESKDEQEGEYISLMTVHASKGLEFPVVFVVGCEEGFLPHKNSAESPQGVDEERRLFYVALTRAKQKLYLSHAHNRQTGFQKEIRKPSRFIREMPDSANMMVEALQAKEDMESKQIERKKKTINRLASLRADLDSGKWDS